MEEQSGGAGEKVHVVDMGEDGDPQEPEKTEEDKTQTLPESSNVPSEEEESDLGEEEEEEEEEGPHEPGTNEEDNTETSEEDSDEPSVDEPSEEGEESDYLDEDESPREPKSEGDKRPTPVGPDKGIPHTNRENLTVVLEKTKRPTTKDKNVQKLVIKPVPAAKDRGEKGEVSSTTSTTSTPSTTKENKPGQTEKMTGGIIAEKFGKLVGFRRNSSRGGTDVYLSEWGDWTACNATCVSQGERRRSRICLDSKGDDCQGVNTSQREICERRNCDSGAFSCMNRPCLHNGECRDIPTSSTNPYVKFECSCPFGVSGDLCEYDYRAVLITCLTVMSIFFLVALILIIIFVCKRRSKDTSSGTYIYMPLGGHGDRGKKKKNVLHFVPHLATVGEEDDTDRTPDDMKKRGPFFPFKSWCKDGKTDTSSRKHILDFYQRSSLTLSSSLGCHSSQQPWAYLSEVNQIASRSDDSLTALQCPLSEQSGSDFRIDSCDTDSFGADDGLLVSCDVIESWTSACMPDRGVADGADVTVDLIVDNESWTSDSPNGNSENGDHSGTDISSWTSNDWLKKVEDYDKGISANGAPSKSLWTGNSSLKKYPENSLSDWESEMQLEITCYLASSGEDDAISDASNQMSFSDRYLNTLSGCGPSGKDEDMCPVDGPVIDADSSEKDLHVKKTNTSRISLNIEGGNRTPDDAKQIVFDSVPACTMSPFRVHHVSSAQTDSHRSPPQQQFTQSPLVLRNSISLNGNSADSSVCSPYHTSPTQLPDKIMSSSNVSASPQFPQAAQPTTKRVSSSSDMYQDSKQRQTTASRTRSLDMFNQSRSSEVLGLRATASQGTVGLSSTSGTGRYESDIDCTRRRQSSNLLCSVVSGDDSILEIDEGEVSELCTSWAEEEESGDEAVARQLQYGVFPCVKPHAEVPNEPSQQTNSNAASSVMPSEVFNRITPGNEGRGNVSIVLETDAPPNITNDISLNNSVKYLSMIYEPSKGKQKELVCDGPFSDRAKDFEASFKMSPELMRTGDSPPSTANQSTDEFPPMINESTSSDILATESAVRFLESYEVPIEDAPEDVATDISALSLTSSANVQDEVDSSFGGSLPDLMCDMQHFPLPFMGGDEDDLSDVESGWEADLGSNKHDSTKEVSRPFHSTPNKNSTLGDQKGVISPIGEKEYHPDERGRHMTWIKDEFDSKHPVAKSSTPPVRPIRSRIRFFESLSFDEGRIKCALCKHKFVSPEIKEKVHLFELPAKPTGSEIPPSERAGSINDSSWIKHSPMLRDIETDKEQVSEEADVEAGNTQRVGKIVEYFKSREKEQVSEVADVEAGNTQRVGKIAEYFKLREDSEVNKKKENQSQKRGFRASGTQTDENLFSLLESTLVKRRGKISPISGTTLGSAPQIVFDKEDRERFPSQRPVESGTNNKTGGLKTTRPSVTELERSKIVRENRALFEEAHDASEHAEQRSPPVGKLADSLRNQLSSFFGDILAQKGQVVSPAVARHSKQDHPENQEIAIDRHKLQRQHRSLLGTERISLYGGRAEFDSSGSFSLSYASSKVPEDDHTGVAGKHIGRKILEDDRAGEAGKHAGRKALEDIPAGESGAQRETPVGKTLQLQAKISSGQYTNTAGTRKLAASIDNAVVRVSGQQAIVDYSHLGSGQTKDMKNYGGVALLGEMTRLPGHFPAVSTSVCDNDSVGSASDASQICQDSSDTSSWESVSARLFGLALPQMADTTGLLYTGKQDCGSAPGHSISSRSFMFSDEDHDDHACGIAEGYPSDVGGLSSSVSTMLSTKLGQSVCNERHVPVVAATSRSGVMTQTPHIQKKYAEALGRECQSSLDTWRAVHSKDGHITWSKNSHHDSLVSPPDEFSDNTSISGTVILNVDGCGGTTATESEHMYELQVQEPLEADYSEENLSSNTCSSLESEFVHEVSEVGTDISIDITDGSRISWYQNAPTKRGQGTDRVHLYPRVGYVPMEASAKKKPGQLQDFQKREAPEGQQPPSDGIDLAGKKLGLLAEKRRVHMQECQPPPRDADDRIGTNERRTVKELQQLLLDRENRCHGGDHSYLRVPVNQVDAHSGNAIESKREDLEGDYLEERLSNNWPSVKSGSTGMQVVSEVGSNSISVNITDSRPTRTAAWYQKSPREKGRRTNEVDFNPRVRYAPMKASARKKLDLLEDRQKRRVPAGPRLLRNGDDLCPRVRHVLKKASAGKKRRVQEDQHPLRDTDYSIGATKERERLLLDRESHGAGHSRLRVPINQAGQTSSVDAYSRNADYSEERLSSNTWSSAESESTCMQVVSEVGSDSISINIMSPRTAWYQKSPSQKDRVEFYPRVRYAPMRTSARKKLGLPEEKRRVPAGPQRRRDGDDLCRPTRVRFVPEKASARRKQGQMKEKRRVPASQQSTWDGDDLYLRVRHVPMRASARRKLGLLDENRRVQESQQSRWDLDESIRAAEEREQLLLGRDFWVPVSQAARTSVGAVPIYALSRSLETRDDSVCLPTKMSPRAIKFAYFGASGQPSVLHDAYLNLPKHLLK